MNDELKAKYARIANDPSQLEMFKNDVIDGKVAPAGVKLSGNSLVIPEQPQPEPVIEIDGVKYYHKQEFDLEALETSKDFDLLTGDIITTPAIGYLGTFTGAGKVCRLHLGHENGPDESTYTFNVYPSGNYTSRAFTVVDAQEEVTDTSKICLPTCSAYYGFLSEDGKTFISYYNLKNEGPEYVDSIKQGNDVMPVRDARVDSIESQMFIRPVDTEFYPSVTMGQLVTKAIELGVIGKAYLALNTGNFLVMVVEQGVQYYVVYVLQYNSNASVRAPGRSYFPVITAYAYVYTSASAESWNKTISDLEFTPVVPEASMKLYRHNCVVAAPAGQEAVRVIVVTTFSTPATTLADVYNLVAKSIKVDALMVLSYHVLYSGSSMLETFKFSIDGSTTTIIKEETTMVANDISDEVTEF